jgi:hypothetical protein
VPSSRYLPAQGAGCCGRSTAHALGLAGVAEPVNAVVARLLGVLRDRGRWLLIFDNGEDPAALAPCPEVADMW